MGNHHRSRRRPLGLGSVPPWLVGIGCLCAAGSILAFAYARSQRRTVRSAVIRIEGRSIDSLNLANLRRRVNRSLVVQEVHRVAEIDGEDLRIASRYTGYCRAGRETAIEFGIDSDNNVPFGELECFAYDLRRDPGAAHRIRPVLIDADGSSKKIAVPFLEPLVAEAPFDVLLKCTLPGCMKAGIEYYTSTLSFAQDRVRRYTVRLTFVGEGPEWVRVYECTPSGTTKLLKDLAPLGNNSAPAEYVDVEDDVSAQSTRIYVFRRARVPPVSPRFGHWPQVDAQILENTVARCGLIPTPDR